MKQKFIILNATLFLLTACANKKNQKAGLAKNYFQQSLIAAEKNKREALALIDKSIDADPTPRSYALKAMLLYQIGHYQESLVLFEKVINEKATPASLKTDAYNNYACNLLMVGQAEKAKKIWLDLTQNRHYLSPEVAWFNLGHLELLEVTSQPKKTVLDKNDHEKLTVATNYFKNSIQINSDYIDAYYYLSIALIYLEHFAEAKQTLIQVVAIMPEHENAQKLLQELNNKLKSLHSKQ
jgi:tetratricopeptide (TPR) repeat protein